MTRHRVAVAVAAIAYLGLGVRMGFMFVTGWSDESSDLSDYEPVFDAAVAAVYAIGASMLVRTARVGKTRHVLAIPILFLPASGLAFLFSLLVIGLFS